MATCNAKARNGKQCKQPAINGTSKCRYHGGASLVGIASATFKHGRHSKDLPTRLAARYGEALADPQLLELRDEIALVGVRQGELLAQLDSGLTLQHWKDAQAAYSAMRAAVDNRDGSAMQVAIAALGNALDAGMGDHAVWAEVLAMTEQRRKLVDSEHKRLVAMQQMMSVEQTMTLIARLTETVRKHVADPSILAAIAADLRAVVNVGAGGQP